MKNKRPQWVNAVAVIVAIIAIALAVLVFVQTSNQQQAAVQQAIEGIQGQ